MTTSTDIARDTDTKLAALYTELDRVGQRIDSTTSSILRLAGARWSYRGRRRVANMTLAEALPIVEAEVERMQAHEAANEGVDGRWIKWEGVIAPYDLSNAQHALVERYTLQAQRLELLERIAELDATYTGWNRFFLVTSSAGHVHSSMSCSSCRPTTTFGWLPELSGKTETVAVAELGPALCSVCFPSAPVEHQGGKLTAAQARKRAA